MFNNYLKIAFRNIIRHRFFSLVNIFGLAVSMSSCLLIISMLADQKKYDRFNSDKDRIYRVLSQRQGRDQWTATSPYLLQEELETAYSGIDGVLSIRPFIGGDLRYKENFVTQAGLFADQDFFRFFNFTLKAGDTATALKEPFSMVLTESVAKKLFGDEDPMGKSVSLADRGLDVLGVGIEGPEKNPGDFIISGVIADLGYKTHLHFDFVVSMSTLHSLVATGKYEAPFTDWSNIWEFYQYVRLAKNKTVTDLVLMLNQISDTRYPEGKDKKILFEPQLLTEITLGKFTNNPISFSVPIEGYYFLSFLGLVILLSACFNYTNLSLARSVIRSKEIGVRKINGASRRQVFFQFTAEAVLVSLISLLFSLLILQLLKQAISGFWLNQYLNVGFGSGIAVLGTFVLFSIFTGLLAGLVPAGYLSRFNPIRLLNRDIGMQNRKAGFIFNKPNLGRALIIAQFIFSLVLIITTITLVAQLRHLVVAEYGFDRENIINLKLQGNDYYKLAGEFSSNPDITRISASNVLPAMGVSYGVKFRSFPGLKDSLDMPYFSVDQNFISNFGLKLVAGRNFPEEISMQNEQYVIFNEMAIKQLGFKTPSDAIGQFVIPDESKQPLEIIGVLKDFHHELFMESLSALALRFKPDEFRHINIKVSGANMDGTIRFLEKKWKELDRVHPFSYRFYDEQLAKSHAIFGDVLSIVGFIAFIAITIAALGLLGMATFTAETRRKEIGIRKVLGAEVNGILMLLSRGFLWLLGIAIVVAIPLSYLVNNAWLQEFAYRITFGPLIILSGILLVLLIGVITIGSQTYRAALTNPADILRSE